MTRRKTLKELTLKDNFMFGAVMCDEKNCKRFLEMVLEFPIERVEVSKEKSIVYHLEYKGVRLDVYAKDENNTHYNVEMQLEDGSETVFLNTRGENPEERYMLTELLMQDERRAGRMEDRKESILDFLSEIGSVPDELHERIMQELDMPQLKEWTKLAARVESIEQFIAEM